MGKTTDWERFFDRHAPLYMENCFTKNTHCEVDFLIAELRLKPGASVLDIGCGTGRHAIELARRGYSVTGVDLSLGMLAEAQRCADEAGVTVEFIRADATRMRLGRQFDAAISLCEGAFGLLGQGDDAIGQPLAILRRSAAALKPGARCLFTVLNGYRMARRHSQADVENDAFDPLTLSELSEVSAAGSFAVRERGFVPTELMLLFRTAGLTVLNVWGGTAGGWNRAKIKLDEMETMVVAEKRCKGGPARLRGPTAAS